MARYVVLEFFDNVEAEKFVREVNGQNEINRSARRPFLKRVVGVFVKPGKTCECGDATRINYGDKNQKHGITRGEKFGWWVCTRCNRPRAAGHQLENQIKLSETYQGVVFNDYEFGVTQLSVSGFHTDQLSRPKKLRRKKSK